MQETIENTLQNVLHEKIPIFGCGRTDAGVHASQYFFHADLQENYDFDVVSRLNRALPSDISIFECIPVAPNAHARYDATARSYRYFIHTQKDAFLDGRSALFSDRSMDISKMQQATALLLQYADYYAFCKSPAQFKHTICTVTHAELSINTRQTRLQLHITANRFLTGMIRILVARLLEIGTNRMSIDQFEYHLREKVTPRILTPAPAQGLYLSKIIYPYLERPGSGFEFEFDR